ncbi:MAG: saccharopine dehydrogenase NADP-binding domain-containing protein [Methanobacteriota archaeon]
MRVLLVGSGAQGAVMAHVLARSSGIDEVVCADVSLERAGAAARFAKSRKVRATRLDASNRRALRGALSDVDAVVNAALPRFNLPLTRTALEAGVHYQDLAADYANIRAQLAHSKGFARKGRVGLMQCGGSPGITNVLAREGVDALDSVDAVRVRLISKLDASRPLSLWSAEVALEDMEEPPAVFRDGKVVRVPPFSDEEVFEFPEPFGPQPVLQHMHEEPITFGRFLGHGLRYVDLKMGGHHVYQMKEANAMGLLRREPVRVGKVRVVPRDLLVAVSPSALTPADVPALLRRGVLTDATGCLVVLVEGTRAGARHEIRYESVGPSLREVQAWIPGATNMSYKVGVSAAILIEMLASGEVKPAGVYPPEALAEESRRIFLDRLAAHHIPVRVAE